MIVIYRICSVDIHECPSFICLSTGTPILGVISVT